MNVFDRNMPVLHAVMVESGRKVKITIGTVHGRPLRVPDQPGDMVPFETSRAIRPAASGDHGDSVEFKAELNPFFQKRLHGGFLFRAAACCLFFWFSFAAPLDVPAQEAESVLAEQKTECKTSHNTGDDHASQVGVGKPVGNRDGRVNRVHFAPPLWVVIGASLTAGVIVGIVGIVGAGIAFNVIAFAINFKNRDK